MMRYGLSGLVKIPCHVSALTSTCVVKRVVEPLNEPLMSHGSAGPAPTLCDPARTLVRITKLVDVQQRVL